MDGAHAGAMSLHPQRSGWNRTVVCPRSACALQPAGGAVEGRVSPGHSSEQGAPLPAPLHYRLGRWGPG